MVFMRASFRNYQYMLRYIRNAAFVGECPGCESRVVLKSFKGLACAGVCLDDES
jgi:hypothetical protein